MYPDGFVEVQQGYYRQLDSLVHRMFDLVDVSPNMLQLRFVLCMNNRSGGVWVHPGHVEHTDDVVTCLQCLGAR